MPFSTEIVALVGGILAIASFFIGRQSSARLDGARSAAVDVRLEGLHKQLEEIKEVLKDDRRAAKDELRRMEKEFQQAVQRLHERLDEHIKTGRGG